MIPTWISPWNSKQITSDELIHEVSLDALSELYNIAVLRLPEPEIVIEQDSIIIHSASIDYKYVISFPRVLYDEMTSRFPAALKILQAKYRLLSAAESSNQLDGEAIGETLHYFRSLDRLFHVVSSHRCWDPRMVLVLHGLPEELSPDELKRELKNGAVHYLVVYPTAGQTGSGNYLAVDMPQAISLMNELWSGRSSGIERLFHLQYHYGQLSWLSDDNRWICGGTSDNK